jgi:uncharacterized protein YjiS (DUF1127 family)
MSTLLQERQPSMTGLRARVGGPHATLLASAKPQPAAAIADCPAEAPGPRWRVIAGSFVASLREWRRRSGARRELASFDPRMLRDIGIDPGMVEYEMRQPFWRPVRDWRD